MRDETHIMNGNQVALEALLKVRGVPAGGNPLLEGAKLAGFADEYEMVISLLVGRGAAVTAAPKKRGGKRVLEETEEDRRLDDDEFLMTLEGACEAAGVTELRAPDWLRAMTMDVTKDGFYARIERLVKAGKVSVREELKHTKLYGREVRMRVKLYHSIEGDKEAALREERAKAKRNSSQQAEGGAE